MLKSIAPPRTVPPRMPSPRKPAAPPRAAAAYNRIAPELDELSAAAIALTPIHIDLPRAVALVLGALPGLAALRPAIVKQLPEHKVALLDKLELYALAAWYAHLIALPESGAESSAGHAVKPLLDEAIALRARLLAEADDLARRGLIDPHAIDDIRAGEGHVDTANDLVALSALFNQSWPELAGRTSADDEEVRRAGELGPKLLAALGVREHSPDAALSDAADRRARAVALFVRAYEQTRRAVAYLRWDEGDAELIAPSLQRRERIARAPSAAPPPEPPVKASEEPPADTLTAPTPSPAGAGDARPA
ncbi:hypothetical protein [Sorangium sp. So ce233]|uniref:hypothetical protein n=1 Tax=Sorangium sp. So ce233 TaxID=3133290 RepID=UPI003F63C386